MPLAERPLGERSGASCGTEPWLGCGVEAIVLGIRGVFVPEDAFRWAGIEAAGRSLTAVGIDPARFGAAARLRLRRAGPRSIISRTINDLCQRVPADAAHAAEREAALAVPRLGTGQRQQLTLRYLASAARIAVLEHGSTQVLETLAERLGLVGIAERRLWTDQLGRIGRPPSAFAFRWLARRLDLAPDQLCYVAGGTDMACAASRAGWRCIRPEASQVGDLEWLATRLENGAIAD